MQLSIFVAQILSLIYACVGLAILLGQLDLRRLCQDLLTSPALSLISGCLGLIVGFLLLQSHNTWIWAWPLAITLVAWGLFLGGALLVIYPKAMAIVTRFSVPSRFWALPILAMALLFAYWGFYIPR